MENWQDRTELLIGKENLKKLNSSHVLIAGLGGVGAMAAEMLCRAGIGSLTIVDSDKIQPSNRNRQIPALLSNEGKKVNQYWGYIGNKNSNGKYGKCSINRLNRDIYPFPHQPSLQKEFYRNHLDRYIAYLRNNLKEQT